MAVKKIIHLIFKRWLLLFLTILVVLGYLTVFSTCNNEKNGEQPEPTETIFGIIQNTPGLDSLERYIQFYPEIVTLINSSGSLTLFAPSNSAFESLLSTEGFPSDITKINSEIIRGVLFYHLILDAISSQELSPGKVINTAFPGEIIEINSDGTLKTGSLTNTNIEITQADLEATNGYVHIVEDVFIPPIIGEVLIELTGTVAGTIILGGDFSFLANAILRADSSITQEQMPVLEILRDEDVTIFAPPNDVFEAVGLEVADLNGQQWRIIILYHVIGGTVTSQNLVDRIYTSLLGEDIYTTTGAFINGFPIVVPDAAPASNGTVHVLAGFLRPGLINGGDIVEVATFQGFDSLTVALELTGLKSILSTPNGPFTVFTPPDEAFVGLLTGLGATRLSDIPVAQLTAILSHHVVESVFYSSDMSDGMTLNTLTGVDISVNINQTGISLTDGSGVVTPVVARNVTATNGVIHVVGGILIPQ